jgi:hypothetical protein
MHCVFTGEQTELPCGCCGNPPVQATVTSGQATCGSDSTTFIEHCALLPPVGVVQLTRTELLPSVYGPGGSIVHCAVGSCTEKISEGVGNALQVLAVAGTTTVGCRQVIAGPVEISHPAPVKPGAHAQNPLLSQDPLPLHVSLALQYVQTGYE